MASCTVIRDVPADAGRIWQLLRDFGDVTWIPMASHVELDGEGPGMRRFLSDGASAPIVERLISIDDAANSIVYSIDENMPLPVSRYEATATVTRSEPHGARITWAVDFDAEDEAEAAAAIEMVYDVMAGWLADRANA